MPPPGSRLWLELSHVGELVLAAAVLVAVAATVVLTVVAAHHLLVGAAGLRRPRGWLRWWVHRRAVRRFAAAVAGGDLDAAEAAAAATVGTGPAPRRCRPVPLAGWDERVVIDGAWVDVAAALRRGDGLTAWCPQVRRLPAVDGAVMAVGRYHPVRLRLVSQRWAGPAEVRFAADALVGQVVLRPVQHRVDGDRVEVWVHVEGPRSRRAQRALRVLRRATKTGLRRWADHHAPTPAHHRWPGWPRRLERGPGRR